MGARSHSYLAAEQLHSAQQPRICSINLYCTCAGSSATGPYIPHPAGQSRSPSPFAARPASNCSSPLYTSNRSTPQPASPHPVSRNGMMLCLLFKQVILSIHHMAADAIASYAQTVRLGCIAIPGQALSFLPHIGLLMFVVHARYARMISPRNMSLRNRELCTRARPPSVHLQSRQRPFPACRGARSARMRRPCASASSQLCSGLATQRTPASWLTISL